MFDHFLDGGEDVAAGEVDRGGHVPVEGDGGAFGGEEGADDVGDVAAGEVMVLQSVEGDIEAGLDGGDAQR